MSRGAVVSLSVDDCWRQHALSFSSEFESVGFRGVFFPITGFVGSQESGMRFVDWSDLKDLVARGHEVGSHTVTHRPPGLGKMEKASRFMHQLEADGVRNTLRRTRYSLGKNEEYDIAHLDFKEELVQSRAAIENNVGRPCRSFSYPGGASTKRTRATVQETGYASARTTYAGLNQWGRLRPYALLAQSWDSLTTAEQANGWVDRAIHGAGWLIEVFHAIDLDGYPYSCSRGQLSDHLKYLKSRTGEIETLTIGDVL